MMIFRCVRCKKDVSKPLTELVDFSLLSHVEQTDYIPVGYFAYGADIVKAEKIPIYGGKGEVSERDVVFNLKDLRNTQRMKHRGSGCCGFDGDYINIQCSHCEHEIGAENSDCYMAHFIRVPLENIEKDSI